MNPGKRPAAATSTGGFPKRPSKLDGLKDRPIQSNIVANTLGVTGTREKFLPDQNPALKEESESEESRLDVSDESEDEDSHTPGSEEDDESMSDLIFDGNDTTMLREFFRNTEAYFKLHDKYDENEERKAAYVITKFRRPAALWLEQAIDANAEVELDYSTLKAAMKSRYEDSANESEAKARDYLMRIQQKGTVDAYDTFFESMWTRSNFSDEKEKARLFLAGLYAPTRQYIRLHDSFSPSRDKDWVKDKAQKFEEAKGPQTPSRPRQYGGPNTPGAARTPRDNKGDKCFKCGQFGHWSRDCYSNKQGSASRTSGRSQTVGRDTPMASTERTTESPFAQRPW